MIFVAPIAGAAAAASMGGAGIGAGAAAGASAGMGAAMGAALFNPVTIGLGVAMAGLALYQGMQQKKALKRQYAATTKMAYGNLGILNDQIGDVRRAFYDQTDIASQQYRQGYAALVNNIGTTSGPSVNAVLAAQVANVNVDQLARRTALADTIQSIEYQKQNVKAQAEAGMASSAASYTPAGFQAISGGLQGFQMGLGLSSVIQSAQQASALNDAYKAVLPAAQAGDSNALAQLQALNAGIPPSAVLGAYGSMFTAPFLAQQQLSGIQMETSRNDLYFSQLRNEALRRQLGTSTGRLDNLMSTDRILQTLR